MLIILFLLLSDDYLVNFIFMQKDKCIFNKISKVKLVQTDLLLKLV